MRRKRLRNPTAHGPARIRKREHTQVRVRCFTEGLETVRGLLGSAGAQAFPFLAERPMWANRKGTVRAGLGFPF